MTETLSAATTAATRLVQTLERLEVAIVFGLPGVHNLAIFKALRNSHIQLVGVRHEQTAVYAADGYARATGRLGVALVTTGPGAANTLGATGEAMASGSPVLIIATDIPSRLRRPGVYRALTIVLIDDGGYGMLRFDQRRAGDDQFGVDLVTPDFAAPASSFGIPATTVEGFGVESQDALERSIAGGQAHMIVLDAALTPPPTTSPRWYRKQGGKT